MNKRIYFEYLCVFLIFVWVGVGFVGCGADTSEITCSYNGKTYATGKQFPAKDNCNNCSCIEGTIVCTTKACPGKACGTKGSASCGKDEFCDKPSHCGENDKGGTCQKTPQNCDTGIDPVCGCDNKTYNNGCEANAKGVSVKSKGKCESPKKGCEYNGKQYKDGDGFPDKTGCNKCTCNDGKVECKEEPCPFKACKYEGKEYKHGTSWDKGDSCNKCECFDGKVSCSTNTCKKSCKVGDKEYKHDEKWDKGDGCNTCTCSDGKVTCSEKACKKSCKVGDKEYKHDEKWDKGDGCNTCTCSDGKATCTQKTCSCKTNKDCGKGKYCSTPVGQCGATGTCKPTPTGCPRNIDWHCGCDGKDYTNACVGYSQGMNHKSKGKCSSTPKTCTYNGKTYQDGASFPSTDGCNTCNCSSGSVTCTKKTCSCKTNKDCGKGKYCSTPVGQCGATGTCKPTPTGCTKNIDWHCGCDGKDYTNACVGYSQGMNHKSKGKCSSTPKTCSYGGKTYQDGEKFVNLDGCNVCTCMNGVPACTRRACRQRCKTSSECKTGEFCKRVQGYCNATYGNCHSKPTTCTSIYKPVCGCNGVTYTSDCKAYSKGESIKAAGKCKCSGCTTNKDCSSSQFCKFATGSCTGCGTCTTRPTRCTRIYSPVCGCDNTTHSNACVANSNGTHVKSSGKCGP